MGIEGRGKGERESMRKYEGEMRGLIGK